MDNPEIQGQHWKTRQRQLYKKKNTTQKNNNMSNMDSTNRTGDHDA